MSHFAFTCPPYLGHLHPMFALAQALSGRGHRVSFAGIGDLEPLANRHGCGFVALGRNTHPAGTLAVMTKSMTSPGGLGLFRILADMTRMTRMLCDELPVACRHLQVDGIVTDQLEPAGGLVAAHLDIPYVSIANALPVNREPGIPPPFTDWPYDPTPKGLRRNRGGYRVADLLMGPMARTIGREARRLGLPERRSIESCLSPFAEITQLVPQLDFPRRHLHGTVHGCGPLRGAEETEGLESLLGDGRPLVFASLGTLQGGRSGIFRVIAAACAELDLHLVIAHGGRLSPTEIETLPGTPIVRDFVPQRALLRHAALAVTNGGLNTVLDAAATGVPLLVIPIAFEQGAIAARVAHAGIGLTLPRRRLSCLDVKDAMLTLMGQPAIASRSRQMAQVLAVAGGVSAAASVIEAVTRTGRAMLRTPPRNVLAADDMFEPA